MQPKRKHRHLLSNLFMLLLMAVTFYIIFKDNSLPDILQALRGLNPLFIAVAAVMMLLSILFQGLALGEPFNMFGCPIRLRRKVDYALTGFFFSAITPSSTGGQPMQIYYMCRDNLHLSHVTVSMLVANIGYQFILLAYGISMYLLRFRLINDNMQGFTALFIFGIVMNLVILLAISFALFSTNFAKKLANGVLTLLCRMRIIKNERAYRAYVSRQIDEYAGCSELIRRHPLMLFRVLLYTFLQMTAQYLVPFFVYKAFGLSGGSLLDLLALQAALYLAVSFLPLPGAVGASESGFVRLFGLFFSAGNIVPAMLVSRGISFYAMLLLSGAAVLYMQARRPDPSAKRRVRLLRTGGTFCRTHRSA